MHPPVPLVYYELAQSYNCIFLSTKSIRDPFCWKHLISIMSKKNEACFRVFPKEDEVNTIWMECFQNFPRPLYLFVDLSMISEDFTSSSSSSTLKLLGTANILYTDHSCRVVFSLSSGTRHILDSKNKKSWQDLSTLLSYCEPIYVLGFTEYEAKHYLEVFESQSLKFHEVYPLPTLIHCC